MNKFNNAKLKEVRKAKGYTQQAFAALIGIARTTYAEYEQGKIQPPFDKIQRICNVFHMSQDDFIEVKNDTGIDVNKVRTRWNMSESEKIVLIKRLQDKQAALAGIDSIRQTIQDAQITPADKSILLSLVEYMMPAYALNDVDLDLIKRIEKAKNND